MIERRYHNKDKVYVKVGAIFHPDGKLMPVVFWWEDGRRYGIDRVIKIQRSASLKAGGIGMRYTCMVNGKQIHLFLEEDRWFLERKGEA
jgi:hypothetical protein